MAYGEFVTFEKELKKNVELKESDVQLLRDWCSKQPHLPKITDCEIALLLHSKDYHLESTKNAIDCYFTLRTHMPYCFTNRDPFKLRKAFSVTTTFPLAKPARNGHTVIFSQLIDSDPSHYIFDDFWKTLGMSVDLLLRTKGTLEGFIFVVDMSHLTLEHLTCMNPLRIKKYFYYLQEAAPLRLRGLHFTNSNPVADVLLRMIKPFMTKRLVSEFHVHSSIESIDKFIPIENLPNELGGQAGTVMELRAAEINKLDSYRDWFLEQDTRLVDERLRQEDRKYLTDLFGTDGSFRKLNID